MSNLRDLPNIGKVLEERLIHAGINDGEALRKAGSRQAFLKLRALEGEAACFNTLCALEGAVQGIRWHGLDSETKADLKRFFDSLP